MHAPQVCVAARQPHSECSSTRAAWPGCIAQPHSHQQKVRSSLKKSSTARAYACTPPPHAALTCLPAWTEPTPRLGAERGRWGAAAACAVAAGGPGRHVGARQGELVARLALAQRDHNGGARSQGQCCAWLRAWGGCKNHSDRTGVHRSARAQCRCMAHPGCCGQGRGGCGGTVATAPPLFLPHGSGPCTPPSHRPAASPGVRPPLMLPRAAPRHVANDALTQKHQTKTHTGQRQRRGVWASAPLL
jgi:hypothetical protein